MTNYENMTVEQLREKLATQVMGWVLDLKPYVPKYDAYSTATYFSNGYPLFAAEDWKPDIDHNQSALLLGQIGENVGFRRNIMEAIFQKVATKGCPPDYVIPPQDLHCEIRSDAAWWFLTAPPETICRAILEVIEEKNK